MFSLGTPVSSNNKTDGYNITEILLIVVLGIITLTSIASMKGTFFTLYREITPSVQ